MNLIALKKPKVFIPIIIVVIIIVVGFFFFGKDNAQEYEFIVASKDTLIQEVNVTGNVEPAESVDLAFEKGGRVSYIYVEIGDKVNIGQSLMQLNNSELIAQLNEAKANVEIQKAKLDELKRGTRPEEIQVKEAELDKAQQDLNNYYASSIDVLNDAYAKADDAVGTKTDELFTNDYSDNPQLTFTVSDSRAKNEVKQYRSLSTIKLNEWNNELQSIKVNSSDEKIEQALKNTKEYLNIIRDFMAKALTAVDNAAGVSASTINTYKTNINTGRTNVNTAFTSVSDQEQNIAAQKITVEKVQNELDLILAGTVSEQITAQEAQVKQTEAKKQNIQAQLTKTAIRSPINGIITNQDTKVGEIISANTAIVSVISEANWEIKTDVPEADIAKIEIGDKAKLTLDAYGEDVKFSATVILIDPAETVIEGVSNYKVTLHFDEKDERIRSGMTANLDILTAEKENVIAIPQRAVISKNGDKIVRILKDDETIEEVNVITGIRGSYGNIEIIKGISEGDRVIIFMK